MKNFLKFKPKDTSEVCECTPRRWRKKDRLVLFTILLLASFLRFYGLNWDQNQHLHPDERFLTMVAGDVKWPNSIGEYLNSRISPLNPYNVNYGFFVYGTLPLKIVKAAAEIIKFDQFDYNNLTLVGRFISALFDLGSLFLVFKIGKKIFNKKIGLFASFLYAISVLPIQLSHFFAVDTFVVFFLTLSFYLLLSVISYQLSVISAALGCAFGLALACKISALLFLPTIGLGFIFAFLKNKNLRLFIIHCFLFTVFSYLILRIADPRIFTDSNFLNLALNPQFIANIKELQSSGSSQSYFPPAVQWHKTRPIIFPLKNIMLWGLGLPLGLIAVISVIYHSFVVIPHLMRDLYRFLVRSALPADRPGMTKEVNALFINLFLILGIVLGIFFYQGIQFAKPMRYFYPIYPFLAILTANFGQKLVLKKIKNKFLLFSFYFLLLLWPLSFLSIYSHPHSRITASQWIYENIPPGSTISCEHWDDCLPLGIEDKSYSLYQTEMLTLYDSDTPEKWQKINQQLEKIDYLIMSSNRLWGSIPKVPEKYPLTAKFYQDLFAEKLDFQKVAEITSYPTVPILKIQISDDSAEENFTVFDHPKVIIYKKI